MRRSNTTVAVPALLAALTLAAGFAETSAGTSAKGRVRISGRVTDFQNRAVAGASVELKDATFESVAEAVSDAEGRYALTAPKGRYMALTAVKDYRVKSLEYWAWNVLASEDLEINPRFDRLEVYALNAWRPQGAYPSYQIYFRPMSLARTGKRILEAGGMEALGKLPVIDVAPPLTRDDVAVAIDGEPVPVLRINRISEATGPSQDMVGYVIQTELPKHPSPKSSSVITVTVTDRETGEMGEGSLFVERAR